MARGLGGAPVPPPELGLGSVPRWRVGIFLSVMDVHVNRVPADGTITRIAYRHGRFLNASLDKASEENERNAIAIRLPDGREIAVVQIAGLIARRIVCDVREGDAVHAGMRFGIIRFGSRTDLYLPEGVRPLVAEGQTMVGRRDGRGRAGRMNDVPDGKAVARSSSASLRCAGSGGGCARASGRASRGRRSTGSSRTS